MPATVARNLVADLRPIRRPARVLYAGAAAWLVSGLAHLVVLAASGWAWSGAVSFRKPLTFSVSIALLLATIGWVLDRLGDRPRVAGTIAWTLLLSSTVEVGLITMQAWRGRRRTSTPWPPATRPCSSPWPSWSWSCPCA